MSAAGATTEQNDLSSSQCSSKSADFELFSSGVDDVLIESADETLTEDEDESETAEMSLPGTPEIPYVVPELVSDEDEEDDEGDAILDLDNATVFLKALQQFIADNEDILDRLLSNPGANVFYQRAVANRREDMHGFNGEATPSDVYGDGRMIEVHIFLFGRFGTTIQLNMAEDPFFSEVGLWQFIYRVVAPDIMYEFLAELSN